MLADINKASDRKERECLFFFLLCEGGGSPFYAAKASTYKSSASYTYININNVYIIVTILQEVLNK